MLKPIVLLFTAITVSFSAQAREDGTSYDFDHKVHYKQQRISEGKYAIELLTKEKTRFPQLATFLIRHAYTLCGSYGFTLQINNGVEKFDDRRISPNYIQPSLSANLECPKK